MFYNVQKTYSIVDGIFYLIFKFWKAQQMDIAYHNSK